MAAIKVDLIGKPSSDAASAGSKNSNKKCNVVGFSGAAENQAGKMAVGRGGREHLAGGFLCCQRLGPEL